MPVTIHCVVTDGTTSTVFDKTYETADEVKDQLLCLFTQYQRAGWTAVTLDPESREVILQSPDKQRVFYASAQGDRLTY